jgi:hypothetical protein
MEADGHDVCVVHSIPAFYAQNTYYISSNTPHIQEKTNNATFWLKTTVKEMTLEITQI